MENGKVKIGVLTSGEIIAFVLTGANVSDKDPNVFKVLAKRLYGKLFSLVLIVVN